MKNFFNFSRKDKIGTLLLSGCILILIVTLNIGAVRDIPDPFVVDPQYIDLLNEVDSNERVLSVNQGDSYSKDVVHDVFDPNTLDVSGWMNLGFSEKQAKSILKFKNLKGRFSAKEDLKEVYVISDKKYAEIEPYVQIAEYVPVESAVIVQKEERDTSIWIFEEVELNSASKEDLIKLKGIGPYYADKFLSQREKIGGFIEMEQINGLSLSDDAKNVLMEYGILDTDKVIKTNVNTASKKELRAIPFSNWLVVSRIMKVRDQMELTNLDFLTKDEISDLDLVKLLLYVEF